MIKLRGWLVVPGAPRFPAVDGHERSLIANKQNDVRIIGIDPHILIVVAAGSTAKTRPSFPAIRRFHRHRARAIDDIWVFRINFRHRQITAADAAGWPSIGGDALPVFARIIGTINPHIGTGSIFAASAGHRSEKSAWLARRNREIDLNHSFGQTICERAPSLATVGRLKESSTCSVVLVSVLPGTQAQLPKRGV